MHTPSTRTLSALAYDRGEEYDPGQPPSPALVEALSLVEHAVTVVGDDGPYERARQRRRERREQTCDPRLVLRRGRDRRAVGDDGSAVPLIDRAAARACPPRGAPEPPRVQDHNLRGGHMSMTISTILLAEEHDATRAFLADNLTADGYRVLTAPDRAKALALLSTAHPDLILIDVNGGTLELVDAIRSGEGLAGRADPDTPLIVHEPRRRPAAADPDARARRRRRRAQAVRLPGAAGPDRGGAEALRAAAERSDRACGTDRDRRPLAPGVGVRPAGRAVGQGARPAGDRSPARRRECSPARS